MSRAKILKIIKEKNKNLSKDILQKILDTFFDNISDSLKNKRQRNLSERIAINTVIQGSAADLIKIALINVLKQLQTGNWTARLLLQIHDELVFECPEDEIADLQEMVVHEMESAAELEVPLKVDVKTGPYWADCEPV